MLDSLNHTDSISLKNLLEFPAFKSLTLAAGGQGLNRKVRRCVTLEYQFHPEMKSKYYYTAFGEGDIVMTTFMYAIDNVSRCTDALKHLHILKVAGIVIHNVFHLKFPESFYRYANNFNIPVFFVTEFSQGGFEAYVLALDRILSQTKNTARQNIAIDELLKQELDDTAIARCAYQLYPSIGKDFRVDYYRLLEPAEDAFWEEVAHLVDQATPSKACCRYKNGIFIFHSLFQENWSQIAENTDPTIQSLRALTERWIIGIGWIHHKSAEFKHGIEEAYRAAMLLKEPGSMRFGNMGIFRILYNAVDDYRLQEFCNDTLQPIINYDEHENGKLIQSLFGLIEYQGDIRKLANSMGQHENTVRQRLKKIENLTGLNYRNPDHYEQLSIAVKIRNYLGDHVGSFNIPVNFKNED